MDKHHRINLSMNTLPMGGGGGDGSTMIEIVMCIVDERTIQCRGGGKTLKDKPDFQVMVE